ncbi:MAG: hypothetical protein MJZ24_01165 [Paludibacteraceae bacterium]|nr:hypothetical protein [Paludibacteraceae bacterium]
MIHTTKISEFYSIVLIGGFNPLIFHPFWMLQKGLISEKDVTEKEILVHDQLTRFKIGDWLEFNVNKNRCEFKIASSEFIPIMLDLIKGTLNALPEVPITSIGINRGCILQLDNEKDYYNVGATLAPLDLWNDSFANPRLRTIAIEDTTSDNFAGKTRCLIIKPAEIKDVKYAIDVNMNNHYELDEQKVVQALKILDANALVNYDSFDTIVTNLLNNIK